MRNRAEGFRSDHNAAALDLSVARYSPAFDILLIQRRRSAYMCARCLASVTPIVASPAGVISLTAFSGSTWATLRDNAEACAANLQRVCCFRLVNDTWFG